MNIEINSASKKYSSKLGLTPSRFSCFSAISERFSGGKGFAAGQTAFARSLNPFRSCSQF